VARGTSLRAHAPRSSRSGTICSDRARGPWGLSLVHHSGSPDRAARPAGSNSQSSTTDVTNARLASSVRSRAPNSARMIVSVIASRPSVRAATRTSGLRAGEHQPYLMHDSSRRAFARLVGRRPVATAGTRMFGSRCIWLGEALRAVRRAARARSGRRGGEWRSAARRRVRVLRRDVDVLVEGAL
jgi:hypothetical protein